MEERMKSGSKKLSKTQRDVIEMDLKRIKREDRLSFMLANVDVLVSGKLGPSSKYSNALGFNTKSGASKLAMLISLAPILGYSKTKELVSYQMDDGYMDGIIRREAKDMDEYYDMMENLKGSDKMNHDLVEKLQKLVKEDPNKKLPIEYLIETSVEKTVEKIGYLPEDAEDRALDEDILRKIHDVEVQKDLKLKDEYVDILQKDYDLVGSEELKSDIQEMTSLIEVARSVSEIPATIYAIGEGAAALPQVYRDVKGLFSGSEEEKVSLDLETIDFTNDPVINNDESATVLSGTLDGTVSGVSDVDTITSGSTIPDGAETAYMEATDQSTVRSSGDIPDDAVKQRGIKEGPYMNPVHPDALSIFFGSPTNPDWIQGLFTNRESWELNDMKKEFMFRQSVALFTKYGADMLIMQLVYDINSNVLDVKRENEEIIQLYIRVSNIKPSVDTRVQRVLIDTDKGDKIQGDKLNPFRVVSDTLELPGPTDMEIKLSDGKPPFVKPADKPYDNQILMDLGSSITKGKLRNNIRRMDLEVATDTVSKVGTKIPMATHDEFCKSFFGGSF